MSAIVLQLFVGFCLMLGALLLFAHGLAQSDHEHVDRLTLLPLEDETTPNEPAHRPESHGSDS